MPRFADLEVEFVRAESDKYAAPLLLLHGLWTSPPMWRAAATYWSHRGWNCYAPAWRTPATATWSTALEALQRLAAALPRPIAVGHDLGALLAFALADTCAAVAISPPPSGPTQPHPLSRSLRARWARWRSRPYVPTQAEARSLLGIDVAMLQPESSGWWGEIERVELPHRPGAARLLVAGGRDPLRPTALEATAANLGADVLFYPEGAHDLPHGPQWQAVVADVHRWIVRRLGGDLLLLRGDEDLVDG